MSAVCVMCAGDYIIIGSLRRHCVSLPLPHMVTDTQALIRVRRVLSCTKNDTSSSLQLPTDPSPKPNPNCPDWCRRLLHHPPHPSTHTNPPTLSHTPLESALSLNLIHLGRGWGQVEGFFWGGVLRVADPVLLLHIFVTVYLLVF